MNNGNGGFMGNSGSYSHPRDCIKEKTVVLTFSSEDAAERVKRFILKSGNTATRNGCEVTTTVDGYYRYAYAMQYKGLPHYTRKELN